MLLARGLAAVFGFKGARRIFELGLRILQRVASQCRVVFGIFFSKYDRRDELACQSLSFGRKHVDSTCYPLLACQWQLRRYFLVRFLLRC